MKFSLVSYLRRTVAAMRQRHKEMDVKSISLKAALVALGLGAAGVFGSAYAAEPLQDPTRNDLLKAMQGEAFATLKYWAYADAARARGDEHLAELFERIAEVERDDHFAQHAKLYGLVGSNAENLRSAIGGENYETATMYPEMAQGARARGDKAAAQVLREIGADEAAHRDAFQAALQRTGVQ